MSTPASTGEKPIFGRPLVILLVMVFVALYVGGLVLYGQENTVKPVHFDLDEKLADKDKQSGGLNVAIRVVSVDPVKKQATVEIDPEPYGDVVDDNDADAPDKDVSLDVNTAAGRKTLDFPKNKPMGAQQVILGLADGDVSSYPLDRYNTQLSITSYYDKTLSLAMTLDSENDAKGFNLKQNLAKESVGKKGEDGEITLDYHLERSFGNVAFAFAVMLFMALLAIFALTVSSMVALGGRKFEFGMLAWLGAILFALPALRNAWPLGPPVGAFGDFAVFFWAEILVIFCISMLVITWFRRTRV